MEAYEFYVRIDKPCAAATSSPATERGEATRAGKMMLSRNDDFVPLPRAQGWKPTVRDDGFRVSDPVAVHRAAELLHLEASVMPLNPSFWSPTRLTLAARGAESRDRHGRSLSCDPAAKELRSRGVFRSPYRVSRNDSKEPAPALRRCCVGRF